MQIRSAALTDIGKLRKKNEDRYICDDVLQLYGVADGIGGLPYGAEAAQLAIDTLREAIATAPDDSLPDLVSLTRSVNNAVCNLSMQISPFGMGATLTYALLRQNRLCLAHAGDSRCYCLRKAKLTALTTDHTVENEIRRDNTSGKFKFLSESQLKSLTRCIGQQTELEVDTLRHPLNAGDRYLFCSDGIDKAINESELATILSGEGEPRDILRKLITLANKRGGLDNATGVLVFVDAA